MLARIAALEEEVEREKQTTTFLRKENKTLKLLNTRTKARYDALYQQQPTKATREKIVTEALSPFFQPSQIRCFLKGNWSVVRGWEPETIQMAMTLKLLHRLTYDYLREKKIIPLPGRSTLRDYFRSFTISEGYLESVSRLIAVKVQSMSPIQRLTCLSMDEIHLRSDISYDKQTDRVIGPHKAANVVMARGLCNPWKVPVFYQHNAKLTKDTLMDIVKRLESEGLHVLSLVTDQGSNNLGLARDLDVTPDQPGFQHPTREEEKIFFLYDMPHLVKSLRNNFLDYGFVLPSGETVTAAPMFRLLEELEAGHYKTSYKLSRKHLLVKGADRQRVHLATELFSESVGIDLEQQFPEDPEALALAKVVKMVDNWFDCVNSREKYDPKGKKLRNAYSVNLDIRSRCLEEFYAFVKDLRVVKHKKRMKWQNGMLQTTKSLMELYTKLQSSHSLEFLMSSRLNQDCLESMFSTIRYTGAGPFSTPGALEFQWRLRNYILRGCSDVVSASSVVKPEPQEDNILTADLVHSMVSDDNDDIEEDLCAMPLICTDKDIMDELEEDELPPATGNVSDPFGSRTECEGFNYICGYLALAGGDPSLYMRAHDIDKNQEEYVLSSWITEKNNGGLVFPAKTLVKDLRIMENDFQEFHKDQPDGLSRKPGVVGNLTDILARKFPSYKRDLLRKFVMTRTAIQMRNIREKNRIKTLSARARKKPIEYDY